MGNCVATRSSHNPSPNHKPLHKNAKRDSQQKPVEPRKFTEQETYKWKKILTLNLDRADYQPILQFQLGFRDSRGGFNAPDQMAPIVLEFKRYFFLAAISPPKASARSDTKVTREDLAPSPIVDRFWRLIVGNTQLYDQLCSKFLGGVLHRDSKSLLSLEHYKKTKSMYKAYFGSINSNLWPPYKELEQLERAHHGYIRLNLENFLDFGREFQQKVVNVKSKEEIQKLYLTDMTNLRAASKFRLQEMDEDDGNSSTGSLLRTYYFENSQKSIIAKFDDFESVKSRLTSSRGGSPKSGKANVQDIDVIKEVDDQPSEIGETQPQQNGESKEIDEKQEKSEADVSQEKEKEEESEEEEEEEAKDTEEEEIDKTLLMQYLPATTIGDDNNVDTTRIMDPDILNLNRSDLSPANPPYKHLESTQIQRSQALDDTVESEALDLSKEEEEDEDEENQSPSGKQSEAGSVEVGGGDLNEDSQLEEYNELLIAEWEYHKKKWETRMEKIKIPRIVRKNFRLEINVSEKLCEAVYQEYKRFLILKNLAAEDTVIIPSYFIKIAWDYHIYQTKAYARFCNAVFGKFLHSLNLALEPVKEEVQDYGKTLQLYEYVFRITPVEQLWPPPQQRFYYPNYNRFKMINIRGYMTDIVLDMLKKKKDENFEEENDQYRFDMFDAVRGMQMDNAPQQQ